MGTNYYALVNQCKTCGKPDTEFHIGKSSMGWTFNFQGLIETPVGTISSYQDLLKMLRIKGVKIKDEYGRRISLKAFRELVESKKQEKHNHAKQFPEHNWLDNQGNSFSGEDFC